jgi:hypothetical protein
MEGSGYTTPFMGSAALPSLDGTFYGLYAATASGTWALRSFAEQANDTFSAGQTVPNIPQPSYVVATGARNANGQIALVTEGLNAPATLAFVEGGPAGFSGEQVFVGGQSLKGVTVVGTGYANDGTAWFMYFDAPTAPAVLTVARRSGSLWSNVATLSVNNGVAPPNGWQPQGPSLAVTPAGDKALVLWTTPQGTTAFTGFGVFFDFTTNTFSSPSVLVPETAVNFATLTTSASFSTDGTAATYVFANEDGRAWTGSATNGVLSPATAFHPELVLATNPAVIYDSCDNPLIVYGSKANASAPSYTYNVAPLN